MTPETTSRLRREILELVPWTIELEVSEGVTTGVARDASASAAQQAGVAFHFGNPRDGFAKTLHSLYPAGLNQRSFLDCHCNCGAYCFWVKELGGGRTLGIDASELAIRQARFVQRYRQFPLTEFAMGDVVDLPRRMLPRFDLVLFKGLFHRLANPLQGLEVAANLAREVLIVNTPVGDFLPEEPGDGALYYQAPAEPDRAGGQARGCWLPSGPGLLVRWLQAAGFAEVKLHFHTKARPPQPPRHPFAAWGHVEIMAARVPGLTERLRTTVQ